MDRVEQTYKEALYEEGMALARAISEKVTGQKDQVDPELVRFFVALDAKNLIRLQLSGEKPAKTEKDSTIARDLEKLGVDTAHEDLIKIPKVELFSIKFEIIKIRSQLNELLASIGDLYSAKELNLLLQKDIPDPAARKILIDLLFVEGFYNQTRQRLLDDEEKPEGEREEKRRAKIYNIGSREDIAFLKKKRRIISSLAEIDSETAVTYISSYRPKNSKKQSTKSVPAIGSAETSAMGRLYDLGDTREAVQRLKEERGTKSTLSKPSKVLKLAEHRRSKLEFSEEDKEEVVQNIEKLHDYARSLFSMTLSRLSQLPENIAWASDPRAMKMFVTPKLLEDLKLVKNLCRQYGFFDYVGHLEPALKAFMRVYLGIYEDYVPAPNQEAAEKAAQAGTHLRAY